MISEKRVKYNMWKNTGFMIGNAWNISKSVLFISMSLAFTKAGQIVTELLIAPAILNKVEKGDSIGELIGVIVIFSSVLIILNGLHTYLNANTLFGRVEVRQHILHQVGNKIAGTSYPNILDTEFINSENKAFKACSGNSEPTEYIWNLWIDIIAYFIGFLVYLGLLTNLNLWLAGIVVATTLGGYFINKNINNWGYMHREEEAEYTERMGYIQRIIAGRGAAKDIRIFGLGPWLNEVWYKTLKLYQIFIKKRERIYLWTNIVDLLLSLLRNGLAYVFLIWLTLSKGMSASEFLLYFSAISGFTQWITGILDKLTELHKQSLELSSLREFLEWPEPFKFEEGEALTKELDKQYEIRLEQVSYQYPKAEHNTLNNINLVIKPGEKLAIVGLNGAGKTTLVKLICGFQDPTEGRVLLNGEDIRRYNRRDYYRLFSAVFQDFSVLEASVAENVAQKVNDIEEERVWECIEKAGLTEKINSLPNGIHTHIGREIFEDGVELSGGQTQRLMLARALYKSGAILILDEPTAALDPIAENDIYRKYNEMTANRTSIFISHRLASTRFCDRILFMEEGKIAEEGSHELLLEKNGGYAKLFQVQSQYYREGDCYGK